MKKLCIVLTTLVLAASCGGKGSSSSSSDGGENKKPEQGRDDAQPRDPANPTDPTNPGTPGRPFSCEQLWANHVAQNPQRLKTVYRHEDKMMFNGTERTTREAEVETLITESNTRQIVKKITTNNFAPSRSTNQKTETESGEAFIAACKRLPTPGTPPTNNPVDIITQRDESVTVRAGTFDSHYVKAKLKAEAGRPGEGEMESWSNKSDPTGLLLKSKMVMKMDQAGRSFTSINFSELVELVRP